MASGTVSVCALPERGTGLALGTPEHPSLAFKDFSLALVPFILPLSSTSPFSSEEEPEGDVVQRVSLQPPKVLSRSAPQPQDNWGWSDSETSEESAQPPGKGSGGLASSGESSSSSGFSVPRNGVSPLARLCLRHARRLGWGLFYLMFVSLGV